MKLSDRLFALARTALLIAAVIFAYISFATADTLIKVATSSSAMSLGAMVIPERSDTSLIWLGDGKARMDAATGVSMLYDAKTDSTVMVYHKFEIYTNGMSSPFGGGGMTGSVDLTAGLAALNPTFITHVTETSERKVIAGWNCIRWSQIDSIPMMGAVMITDIWATEEVNIDAALYSKLTNVSLQLPGMTASLQEQAKIKGLPILAVSEMRADSTSILPLGGVMRNEIVLIQEVEVPPGHYDIPAGYEPYRQTED